MEKESSVGRALPEGENPFSEEEDIEVKIERDPELAAWERERIIVHRVTFKRMLAIGKKNFPGMWALYCFYFEKARKDKTNQPWALDKYCMKGLRWSKEHFYKIKKLLLENEFIEQVIRRNENSTKIDGFYIRVNYMNSTNNVKCPENQDSREIKCPENQDNIKVNSMNSTNNVYCPEKPTSRKNLPVEKTNTSALKKEEEVLKENNNKENVAEFFKEINQELKSRGFSLILESSESRAVMEKLQGNGFDDNEEYLGFVLDKVSEKDNPTGYFLTSIKRDYYRGQYEESGKEVNGYLDDWSERIRCEIEKQKKIKAESDWAQDFWNRKSEEVEKDRVKLRAEIKEMDEAQRAEAVKMEEKAKREDIAKRTEKLQVDMDILHVSGIPAWYVQLYGELMGKELSEKEMSEQLRSKIFEMQKLRDEENIAEIKKAAIESPEARPFLDLIDKIADKPSVDEMIRKEPAPA